MFTKASIGPISLAAAIAFLAVLAIAAAHPAYDKDRLLNELQVVDDDGMVDPAILRNSILIQRMLNRMRAQEYPEYDVKRSGNWKQCAFNAVSCFGK